MKKGLLLSAVVLFGFAQANAQRTPDIGFGIQAGNPEGAYESLYGGTPFGLGINASFPISKWGYIPLEVGFDASTNTMGTTSASLPYIDEFGNNLTHNLKIRSVYNDFHVQLRLKPFQGKIKPYGDLLVGVRAHKTVLDNSLDDGFGEFGQQRELLQRDATASYGWAVGLQLELSPAVNLDIKLQKLWGGRTSFADQSSVVIDAEGAYACDIIETPSANLFVGRVGLTFNLGCGARSTRVRSSRTRVRTRSHTCNSGCNHGRQSTYCH